MNRSQRSYQEKGKGCLYLVPTPIGNLQDITFRAIETLKMVDYIAAEDTRHTMKLLNHFQIEQKLISYHEHNKDKSGPAIIEDLLQEKQVALVTDAGTPGISDPGADLVKLALKKHISVISLPGATASITALVGSGISTDRFLFYGFLDRNKKKKKSELEELQRLPYTLIFYEAPHRLRETLLSLQETFTDRTATLVREISKKHEEYIRGNLVSLLNWAEEGPVKGEFCIIVEGVSAAESKALKEEEQASLWWSKLSIEEHVQQLIDQGEHSKNAIRKVAKERSISKREVYQAYHLQERYDKQ